MDISSTINIYKIIWIFTIGSILGYCVEMIWCYVRNGHFESRKGLIYGPISPVYGIGGVALTLLLYRFIDYNGIIIFFISAIIGGAFEYLCSWVQEKVFGSVSWEYNSKALSIHGRTSVEYSVFWGILGVFFLRDIYPFSNNKNNHSNIFSTFNTRYHNIIFSCKERSSKDEGNKS